MNKYRLRIKAQTHSVCIHAAIKGHTAGLDLIDNQLLETRSYACNSTVARRHKAKKTLTEIVKLYE